MVTQASFSTPLWQVLGPQQWDFRIGRETDSTPNTAWASAAAKEKSGVQWVEILQETPAEGGVGMVLAKANLWESCNKIGILAEDKPGCLTITQGMTGDEELNPDIEG